MVANLIYTKKNFQMHVQANEIIKFHINVFQVLATIKEYLTHYLTRTFYGKLSFGYCKLQQIVPFDVKFLIKVFFSYDFFFSN